MGRPKKQYHFEPPGFKQAVRAQFLRFGLHHEAPAFRLLGTQVWNEEMSLRKWAERFYVTDTWVEEWGQRTLDCWHRGISPPQMLASGTLKLYYPIPEISSADADVFSFAVNEQPVARMEIGLTRGGKASAWGEGEDDEAAFRRSMHGRLDTALDAFFAAAVRKGHSERVVIPKELDLKIECAAVYVLCQASREELVARLSTNRVSVDAMYAWLQEGLELLELKPRPAGRRRIV